MVYLLRYRKMRIRFFGGHWDFGGLTVIVLTGGTTDTEFGKFLDIIT